MSFLNLTLREPTKEDLLFSLDENPTKKIEKKTVEKESLSEDEINTVFTNVNLGDENESEEKFEFFQREKTVELPKSYKTIESSFPPSVSSDPKKIAPLVEKKSLKVTGHFPSGKRVYNVKTIRIKFNQPMVFITSLSDLPKLPIVISPSPSGGEWQWINTNIIVFKHEYRFAKATQYSVTIPKGIKSASGVELKKDVVFSFKTPTVKMLNLFPGTYPLKRNPLMFVDFNQKIEKDKIIDFMSFTKHEKKKSRRPMSSRGRKKDEKPKKESAEVISIQKITKEEALKVIDGNPKEEERFAYMYREYRRLLTTSNEDTSLWFTTTLKLGSTYDFTIKKGTPSSEGPLTTKKKSKHLIRTYGKMRKKSQYPKPKTKVVPQSTFTIQFSNPICLDVWNEKFVTIKPSVKDLSITASNQSINLRGNFRGNATYKVTVSGELSDAYGQLLKKNITSTFTTKGANQSLIGATGSVVSLNPFDGDPTYICQVVNIANLSGKIYKVHPNEYQNVMVENRSPKTPPEYLSIETKCKKDNTTDVKVDLKNYLNKSLVGQLLLALEPSRKSFDGEWRDRPKIRVWIQVTKIGLTVLGASDETCYFFATDLVEGKPIKNPSFCIVRQPVKKRKSTPKKSPKRKKTPKKSPKRKKTPKKSPKTPKKDVGEDSKSPETPKKEEVIEIDEKKEEEKEEEIVVNVQKKKGKNEIHIVGDENGVAAITKFKLTYESKALSYVKKGKDIAFVRGIQNFEKEKEKLILFSFTDRNLYKPKEEITVKAIVRKCIYSKGFGELKFPEKIKLKWKAKDSKNVEFDKGEVEIDEKGCFLVKIKVKDTVNLGQGSISFENKKKKIFWYSTTFKIEEFRKPEFETTCKVKEGPYFVGGKAVLTANAFYYSGGSLNGVDCRWLVSQSESNFVPPLWEDKKYSFKSIYKKIKLEEKNVQSFNLVSPSKEKSLSGTTGSNGDHKLCVLFSKNKEYKEERVYPTRISCNCSIQDLSRQTISASNSIMVHPCKYYIGLKAVAPYGVVGSTLKVSFIVCDMEGGLKSGINVKFKVIRRHRFRKGYKHVTKDEIIEEFTEKSDSIEKEHEIKITKDGRLFIYAEIIDEDGMKNTASTRGIYIVGKKDKDSGTTIEQKKVVLMPNKKVFNIDDKEAKILVETPFENGFQGIIMGFCSNCVLQQHFQSDSKFSVVPLKIKETFVPNILLRCYVFSSDDHKGSKIPSFAFGEVDIEVTPKGKKLEVEINPNKLKLRPKEKTFVDVTVKGEKVSNSLVTLVIVDDSILSMSGYTIPSPISVFYKKNTPPIVDKVLIEEIFIKGLERTGGSSYSRSRYRSIANYAWGRGKGLENMRIRGKGRSKQKRKKKSLKVRLKSSRSTGDFFASSFLSKKKERESHGEGAGGQSDDEDDVDDSKGKSSKKIVEVRKDFSPLILFVDNKETGEDGKVRFEFEMKDELSRYSIFALATNSEDYFGLEKCKISTSQPFSIRCSLPRFLNLSDQAEFLVIVQNQTNEKLSVSLACKLKNLKLLSGVSSGIKFELDPGARTEVEFPLETVNCGPAHFQIVGRTKEPNEYVDAVQKEIPVYSPASSQSFSQFGTIDDEKEPILQPFAFPKDIFVDYGALTITTSSTAMQSLCDAYIYLVKYKFDCVEQCASKLMSIVCIRKFLEEFNVPGMPSPTKINKVLKKSLETIEWSQSVYGFYRFWSTSPKPNLYLSIFCAMALCVAKANGHRIGEVRMLRAKKFMMNINDYLGKDCGKEKKTIASLKAFALFVLTKMFQLKKKFVKKSEMSEITKIGQSLYLNSKKHLTAEGKAWLAYCLYHGSLKKDRDPIVKGVLELLQNDVNETNELANFITTYGDDGKLIMLHSDRRTDAAVLEVLIHIKPKSKLIPKLVNSLLANKKKGRWNSTQENIFVLLALRTYFDKFEGVTPKFVSRVWLGNDFCGEKKFKGRSKDAYKITIPQKVLEKRENSAICVAKVGKGRLYYRVAYTYARKEMNLKAVNYGFKVERVYQSVTKNEHVVRQDDGIYKIQVGELVRVVIKFTVESKRVHVALCDYIPSGFEPLNPELPVCNEKVKEIEKEDEKGKVRMNTWFEYQNIRDERVEAFATQVFPSVYNYSYLCRATTKGKFKCPPTKMEEMYYPEVHGLSKTDDVIIV